MHSAACGRSVRSLLERMDGRRDRKQKVRPPFTWLEEDGGITAPVDVELSNSDARTRIRIIHLRDLIDFPRTPTAETQI